MNEHQRMQKKKDREKKSKAKVLARRAAMRTAAKEERENHLAQEKLRRKPKPFRKGMVEMEGIELSAQLSEAEVKDRLEHNMKILQALEEEYEKEISTREALNEEMEAEGLKNFEEKVQEAVKRKFGGEAGVRFITPDETFDDTSISESFPEKVPEE
jgi:hypothetical protein